MKQIFALLFLLPSLGFSTNANYQYSDMERDLPNADVEEHTYYKVSDSAYPKQLTSRAVLHQHGETAEPEKRLHRHGLRSKRHNHLYHPKKNYHNHVKRPTKNDDNQIHGHD